MATTTKGSVTSNFPDSMPSLTAQSEAKDPVSEDTTLAEGRDANKWSAEIEAIAAALGTGGRGEVTVSGVVATIEEFSYIYQGTKKTYSGTTTLALQAGQYNYIYLNSATNTAAVATGAWPTTPHYRLATWDDSGASAVLTDRRPHDLRPCAEYDVYSDTAGNYIVSGIGTVTNGNTSIAVTFPITFADTPHVTLGVKRGADANLRYADFSNLTTTGMIIHINLAAPASGIIVHYHAKGTKASGSSGS